MARNREAGIRECIRCHQVADHGKNQTYCRQCHCEISNGPDRRGYIKDRTDTGKNFIRKAKSKPCNDCGVAYPFYVMHFDHVPGRGEKSFNLSRGYGHNEETLQKEIDKCDVVCANCHAERTWTRKQPA